MSKFWKVIGGVVATAAILAASSPPQTQLKEVRQESKPIFVKRHSGAVEQYIVEWTGTVSMTLWETGEPWTLLHPYDDRQGHWDITSQIVRRLYLVNGNGEKFEKKDFATPLNDLFQNQGATVKVTTLRGENLNDSAARRQSDFNNSMVFVNQRFPAVVNADLQYVANAMKSWPNVTNVSY